jgi:hypothetical protein
MVKFTTIPIFTLSGFKIICTLLFILQDKKISSQYKQSKAETNSIFLPKKNEPGGVDILMCLAALSLQFQPFLWDGEIYMSAQTCMFQSSDSTTGKLIQLFSVSVVAQHCITLKHS